MEWEGVLSLLQSRITTIQLIHTPLEGRLVPLVLIGRSIRQAGRVQQQPALLSILDLLLNLLEVLQVPLHVLVQQPVPADINPHLLLNSRFRVGLDPACFLPIRQVPPLPASHLLLLLPEEPPDQQQLVDPMESLPVPTLQCKLGRSLLSPNLIRELLRCQAGFKASKATVRSLNSKVVIA